MDAQHAHVFQVDVLKDKLNEGIEAVRNQTLPGLHGRGNYRGGFLLVDREAGKAELITFWAGTCAEAVPPLYASLRQSVAGVLSGAPNHMAYEVVVEDQAPTSQ